MPRSARVPPARTGRGFLSGRVRPTRTGIMGVMLTTDTVRECARRCLTTADRPLTVAAVAELVNTTPIQAGRALRELERRGSAVRARQTGRPGQRGGRTPDWWTATRP